MLDWFVLIVPLLAVLPIVLLFTFVGCPLDRSGLLTNVPFSFGPGLSNGDVSSIGVTFQASVAEGEGGGSVFKSTALTLSGGELLTAGTMNIPFLILPEYGSVTCNCLVTGTTPSAPGNPPPVTKEKLEDESPPSFHLSRDQTGFHLT